MYYKVGEQCLRKGKKLSYAIAYLNRGGRNHGKKLLGYSIWRKRRAKTFRITKKTCALTQQLCSAFLCDYLFEHKIDMSFE